MASFGAPWCWRRVVAANSSDCRWHRVRLLGHSELIASFGGACDAADKQGALSLAQSLASQLQRTPAPEVLLALYHVAQVWHMPLQSLCSAFIAPLCHRPPTQLPQLALHSLERPCSHLTLLHGLQACLARSIIAAVSVHFGGGASKHW